VTAIDATSLDSVAAYKLISGSVTPRPIAWTSTLNDDLSVNLAPFSSYIFLTYMPPKVGISIGPGTERLKDTLRNINRVGEFVVNSVSASQLQIMAETSRAYPPGLSEAAGAGHAAGEVTTVRLDDADPTLAQGPQVRLCGRMVPHVHVHRRRDDDGCSRRQKHGRKEVICQPVSEPGEEVGGGRSDDDDLGPLCN